MKRALPILGVAGLALLSVTAPANAANDFPICHNGQAINVDVNSLGDPHGHASHENDIIPPNAVLPDGLNWPVGGVASQPCEPPAPPVDEEPGEDHPPVDEEPGEDHPPIDEEPGEDHPPVDEEPGEDLPPVVEEEVVPTPVGGEPAAQTPVVVQAPLTRTPAAQAPAGQSATPQSAVAQVPAATVSRGTNQGYNAQTAVGGGSDSATWLAGLGLLLGAGGLIAIRRTSRQESPTAG